MGWGPARQTLPASHTALCNTNPVPFTTHPPSQAAMVGVTQSLRRTLTIIILVYLAAGCTAIGVGAYFLSTPNKRRQVILSVDQINSNSLPLLKLT